MQKINYQREMEQILAKERAAGRVPRLLLHSCCAPCSSYVLEYLSEYFLITDFFYNPNISPESEHRKRLEEMRRLIQSMPLKNPVTLAEGAYCPEKFFQMSEGLERAPEGGERCFLCYEMRLREAAWEAKKRSCDYFATTLSISPLKNAQKLNEIGLRLEEEYQVKYLVSDFKKKKRVPKIGRALWDLRPVQAELLRLRIFQERGAGKGKENAINAIQ